MRTLRTYLWKEWRDHRAVICGFLVAIPLLVLLAEALAPTIARHPRFPALAAGAGLAILLFSVVAELIPGETRRETMGFLLRMPADLRAAFAAKACVLAAMLGIGAGHAFLCAWLFARPERLDLAPFGYLPWVLALGLWVVPVSSWVPRGALAVPAAAALFAALFAPLVAMGAPDHPLPTDGELLVVRIALAVGAVVAAAWCFLRGYRFGGGALSALWRGGVVVACLALPSYAYGAVRIAEFRRIAPRGDEFRIGGVDLGPSCRIAFIEARRKLFTGPEPRQTTIIADLETGAWRAEPGLVVESAPGVFARHIWPASGETVATLHDGNTGAVLEAKVAQDGEALARARSQHRTASGGRVWSWGDRIYWERRDGTVATDVLGLPALCGLGFGDAAQSRFFDFSRERVFEREIRGHLFVRPGQWLSWTARHKLGREYELIDPDTGGRSPAHGLSPLDVVGPLLDDGRVLVLPREGREMAAVEPESGESRTLPMESGRSGRVIEVSRTLVSREVFRIRYDSGDWIFARFDGARFLGAGGASGRLEPGRWGTLQAVAVAPSGELYCVEDSRRIVALRFGTDERRVLFPR